MRHIRPAASWEANFYVEAINRLSGALYLQPIKCGFRGVQGSKSHGRGHRNNEAAAIRDYRATDWETELSDSGQPIQFGFVVIRVGQASVKEAYASSIFDVINFITNFLLHFLIVKSGQ